MLVFYRVCVRRARNTLPGVVPKASGAAHISKGLAGVFSEWGTLHAFALMHVLHVQE